MAASRELGAFKQVFVFWKILIETLLFVVVYVRVCFGSEEELRFFYA